MKYFQMIFALIIISIGRLTNGQLDNYRGSFRFPMHEVQGNLYELDNGKLFIHRFYYDGQGPQGVIFVAVPKGEQNYSKGIQLNVDEIQSYDLPEILNKNLTLNLPQNLPIDKVGRIVVWCPDYQVSFGRVDLTEIHKQKPNLNLEFVGNFIETEHNISGDLFIRDNETLVIHSFNYDGKGPSVHFFGGEETNLETGKVIQYPYKSHIGILGPKKLPTIRYKDIIVKLPKSLNSYKLKWFSVWCDIFEVSFGHVNFL